MKHKLQCSYRPWKKKQTIRLTIQPIDGMAIRYNSCFVFSTTGPTPEYPLFSTLYFTLYSLMLLHCFCCNNKNNSTTPKKQIYNQQLALVYHPFIFSTAWETLTSEFTDCLRKASDLQSVKYTSLITFIFLRVKR